MPTAGFTYEIRHLPEEAFGIEDYVVRTSDDASVGTVAALLERGGELMLAVEAGAPPLAHARRVVPWSAVGDVDHEALAVWLDLDEEASFRLRSPPRGSCSRSAPGATRTRRVARRSRSCR